MDKHIQHKDRNLTRQNGNDRKVVWLILAVLSFLSLSSLSSAEGAVAPSPPRNVSAPRGLAPEQEAAGLKKEELELAEKLMKEFPNSEESIVLMGNVKVRHGNTAEGISLWKRSLQLNPQRADVYNSMGWAAMSKGQYEEAITHWRKALEIDPRMQGVHNSIARALMAIGRATEAIEELEKDIRISPRSSFSLFLLGQQYLQQKEYGKARKNYEAAITIEPNNTNAHYGLYTVYTKLNQPEKAKQYLDSFKKLKAEDMKVLKDRNDARNDLLAVRKGVAETYVAASRIYALQGKLQETETLLKKAASVDPNNIACLMRLADLYQGSGRISDALQMYKKASAIEPENPLCHLNIGIFYTQLKQVKEAETSFVKAIELAPENSDGYREFAQLYLRAGIKFKEAKLFAEKAVKLEPIAMNYMVLSRACDKNGDAAGALSAMKRATELEPNNPLYKQIYEALQKRK